MWDAVLAAGAAHGTVPYGTEAMHVLRAEKGYIVVGQETDGTVTADDLGLGWTIGADERRFRRQTFAARPGHAAARSPAAGRAAGQRPGTRWRKARSCRPARQEPSLGHITSAYYSAALAAGSRWRWCPLGADVDGKTLLVPMQDRNIPVQVTDPVFYDRGRSPTAWLTSARHAPDADDAPVGPRRRGCGRGDRHAPPAWRSNQRHAARTVIRDSVAALWLGPTNGCWSAPATKRRPDRGGDRRRSRSPRQYRGRVAPQRYARSQRTSRHRRAERVLRARLGPRAFPPGMCTRTAVRQSGDRAVAHRTRLEPDLPRWVSRGSFATLTSVQALPCRSGTANSTA